MKPNRVLSFLSLGFPLIFFLITEVVQPREMYQSVTDVEYAAYFNSRLLSVGRPQFEFFHPATTFFQISKLLHYFAGPNLEGAEKFFFLAHLLAAIFSGVALYIFFFFILRKVPLAAGLFSMAAVLSWPSFLFYLNYWAADSFHVILGLIVATVFWTTLESVSKPDRAKLLGCGVLLGFCLATKMTFLFLAVAIVLSASVYVIKSEAMLRGGRLSAVDMRRALFSLLILPSGMVASFLVFTLPIFGRLPTFLIYLFYRREDTVPADLATSFARGLLELMKVNFLLPVFIAGTMAFLVYGIVRSRKEILSGEADVEEGFDFFSGGVFLLSLMSGFIYTFSTAANRLEVFPGHTMRNVTPCIFFFAFSLPFLFRLSRAMGLGGPARFEYGRVGTGTLAGCAFFMLAQGTFSHLQARQAMIRQMREENAAVQGWFDSKFAPRDRIAYFHEPGLSSFGKSSFYFWGNYAFGNNYFDKELLTEFPRYTYFFIKDIPWLVKKQKGWEAPAAWGYSNWRKSDSLRLPWRIYSKWLKKFPPPYGDRVSEIVRGFQGARATDELVMGENSGIKVAAIAVPNHERHKRLYGFVSLDEFFSLLESRFGPTKRLMPKINGRDWMVILFPKNASPETLRNLGL